jgi:predicted secreted Zn-dependent protease
MPKLRVLCCLAAGWLWVCACASPPPPAPPPGRARTLGSDDDRLCEPIVVTTAEQGYAVSGSTPEELRQSMDAARPVSESGDPFDAITRWNVRWGMRLERRGGLCQLECVNVAADVTLVLPDWRPPEDVELDLEVRWAQFMTRLRQHEEGHMTLAEQTALEVADRARAVEPTRDCQRFEEAVNASARAVIDEYGQGHRDYDAETQHGLAQGATFP